MSEMKTPIITLGGHPLADTEARKDIKQLSEEINNIPDPPDVSDFITRAVNDLANYYRMDETYTREEIDGRISAIPKFSVAVVHVLPTDVISETTIYLVPSGVDGNLYTEYIYVNGTWEILGSQRVDLTGYATQTWTLQQLAGYQPKGNYLTEHQDISGKLDANKLPEAVNTALAQAKASGEFDGANGNNGLDGISPTVNVSKSGKVTTIAITDKNGTKTATVNDGTDGAAGKDGKTAYQYAQDGGYTGTEAEFAAKLASETGNPLRGKKVSFLGDSICAGGSESTSYLGGYGKIIADRNSMIYENVARGGATVTAETYSRSTGNAKPWLCRMVENMSADADYAIIEGGINDGWDETVKEKIGAITRGYDATLDDTTYYGAFESMLKQLVTKFQGKKIGYIAVPKIHSLFDSSQNAPNFYHIALECCAKWGVSVCDLNTITPPVEYLSDLGTAYTADACHPTYEGYLKYYCDPIEAWMRTLTTGASVGQASSVASGDYVRKSDVQIKKAQLTLDDGSTVLIDVVVASAGATLNKYINLVPEAVDTTGNVYNGTGYKKDYRLSSSGAEKSQAGAVVTGYIPAAGGDVVRMAGVLPWYQSSYNNNYLCAYDSDFNFVGAVYNTVEGYSYTKDIAASCELGDVCEITLASGMNIAYIRASWPGFTAERVSSTADLIVTVNQEIT